jgi:DNA-directed RNA polymerase specialized sigma subunit
MEPTDEQIAAEIADLLMRRQLQGGPLDVVRGLTRLLRILHIAIRVIKSERNRYAYGLGARFTQRDLAAKLGVTLSTAQRWMDAGAQQVSRETSLANSELNGE